MFQLHPQLETDTLLIGDLTVCRLLLMNNAVFPWLILVPRRADMRELFDLEPADYKIVMDEVRRVAEKFAAHTKADKINIAALGNMVPQLHIHIVARFAKDAAWPNPVWNSGVTAAPYASQIGAARVQEIRAFLQL